LSAIVLSDAAMLPYDFEASDELHILPGFDPGHSERDRALYITIMSRRTRPLARLIDEVLPDLGDSDAVDAWLETDWWSRPAASGGRA
jgi:hypothetical protein